MKRLKKDVYRILESGNFYFPVKDMGKRFFVKDTLTLEIERKGVGKLLKSYQEIDAQFSDVNLGFYARIIWDEVKQLNLKNYKDCWLCPVHLAYLSDDCVSVFVDILKPVK